MNRAGKLGFGVLYIVLPLVIALLTLGFGRYDVSVSNTVGVIMGQLSGDVSHLDPTDVTVIWNLRLPRAILAMLIGAGLAVSGAAFQGLFTNPLATPDTLGVAAGATFGAVLAIMFGGSLIVVQVCALVTGLLAVFMAYKVGVFGGKRSIVSIILAGIVIGALFQAFVSLLKYLADPQDVLPSITYWIMGSLGRANYPNLALGAPLIIVGIAVIFIMRWRLNIMSLDEDEARSLGVNIKRARAIVIVASTLVTASCVSMCGQVGWVGLVIPHISRMLHGSDNRHVIPISISLGAIFMLLIDTTARTVSASEIPISILTAIIGAPIFIYLLKKTGGNW